jgi:tol-pal system protein YbgF
MMMQDKRLTTSLMASPVLAIFALAIFVSAPVVAQSGNNQAMVDLVIQVQQLQDEVRMLRGMLEDQTLELENLGNRQRDQYLDLDQRITELRSGSADPIVTAGAATTAGALDTTGNAAPAIREDVPDVRPALTTPSSVTGIATPDTQARQVAASPENEKADYDRAFQSLKDLKYADAAEQFLTFVNVYPASDYADNAQYWLGESYYVTRNYDIALEAFQTLLSQYPTSPKIADGLLKIGYTHYELKQWDQARAALTQVQEQYPDTTLARLAGSRLRSMKLEGHF